MKTLIVMTLIASSCAQNPPPPEPEAVAQCESLVDRWLERLAVCDPAVVDATRDAALPRCARNQTVYAPLAFDLCDQALEAAPCTGETTLATVSSRCLDFMMAW